MSDSGDRPRLGPVSGEFPSELLARVQGQEGKAVPQSDDAFREYLDDVANTAASAKQLAADASGASTRSESTATRAEASAGRAEQTANDARSESKATVGLVYGAGAVAAIFVAFLIWLLQCLITRVDALSTASATNGERTSQLTQHLTDERVAADTSQREKRMLEDRVRDLEEKVRVLSSVMGRRQ